MKLLIGWEADQLQIWLLTFCGDTFEMGIIVESYARGTFAENIAKWINNCEKTLSFVYFYQPSILTVLDVIHMDT